jgi:hypothetical protein
VSDCEKCDKVGFPCWDCGINTDAGRAARSKLAIQREYDLVELANEAMRKAKLAAEGGR